jgi:hypothetical protein
MIRRRRLIERRNAEQIHGSRSETVRESARLKRRANLGKIDIAVIGTGMTSNSVTLLGRPPSDFISSAYEIRG